MQKLTVIIITYNAAAHIGRCMDSVSGVADEILVMDSFSTDGTGTIVQEKGGRLLRQDFAGYGAQKNDAALLAAGSHILFLDADESLSEELAAGILKEKADEFPFDGYTMNRLNNYCGRWIRHGSWYPDRKLRLIRRGSGRWNDRPVHESIEMDAGSRIKQLGGNLLHQAYADFDEHLVKNRLYSRLSAEDMWQRGRRTGPLKIVCSPLWTFVSGYIIKRGFLDGLYGFVIAASVAYLNFSKHLRLYQMQEQGQRPGPG